MPHGDIFMGGFAAGGATMLAVNLVALWWYRRKRGQ